MEIIYKVYFHIIFWQTSLFQAQIVCKQKNYCQNVLFLCNPLYLNRINFKAPGDL